MNHRRTRPRAEVILNYTIRIVLIAWLGWIFYDGYGFCAAYFPHAQLQRHGHEVEGTVERYGFISRRYGPTTYQVDYRFLVGEQTYRGTSDIPLPNVPMPEQMIVIYDTQDPSNNKLKEGMDQFELRIDTFFIPFAIMIVVFGSMALYYHIRRIRRAKNR